MLFFCYIDWGDLMKVKIFDEEDEFDLENDINEFLNDDTIEAIDIQYQVGLSVFGEEQIYCFSAMILYQIKSETTKK